jgi:hypothetical protein
VVLCAGFLGGLLAPDAAAEQATGASDERLGRIEDHMRALEDELGALKREKAVEAARIDEVEGEIAEMQGLFERVKLGGYGSVRYDANSLGDEQNTFTFRRLVFTTDAQLAPRLRFYSELEYERFRKLELEREVVLVDESDGGPGLQVKQEIEGTDSSEIALEQAWLEWEFDPRLRFRTGGLLVPLGRFNLNHDDNQWNLPRRSLVDRGVPVLPTPSAWAELGAGFTGRVPFGEGGFDYHLYVVNGAVLEPEFEEFIVTRAGKRDKLELEAEFVPQTGTFSTDSKEAKAFTGRLAWEPSPGRELAFSFYNGRYTPDYLDDQSVTSLALDGAAQLFGFELEGEVVTTHWDGTEDVAESFARRALRKESANSAAFDPVLEPEIELELAGLAKRLTGYWLEARYPFWPEFLPRGDFSNPLLVPTLRLEQVWFDNRVEAVGFEDGVLTEFDHDDRQLGRVTLGMAYRPTPLIVFTAAYEYLWTDSGESLDGLTNFLSARDDEDSAHAFLMGASFGF